MVTFNFLLFCVLSVCFVPSHSRDRLVIDCFMFYNELDMLMLRLTELYDVVDYFVLIESSYTHQGRPHELIYNNSAHLFSQFKSKIVHIIIQDNFVVGTKTQSLNHQVETTARENNHRNKLTQGIDILSSNGAFLEDDIIFISDVDEIPDAHTVQLIKQEGVATPHYLAMDLFYYHMNCKLTGEWEDAYVLNYASYMQYVKEEARTLSDLRQNKDNLVSKIISKAGWHFSYFGGEDFIMNKLASFSHSEFNTDEYRNTSRIADAIENNKDIFGRDDVGAILGLQLDGTKNSAASSQSDGNRQFCTPLNDGWYIDRNTFLPKNYKMMLQFGWF